MKARAVLLVVLTATALVVVGRFIYYSFELLRYPYPWETREALSLHHGLILSRGGNLYQLSAVPPQVVPPYGPLFPAVTAVFLQPNSPSFFIPRLISLMAFVCILLTVALLTARFSGSWRWGAVAVAVTLLQMDWWPWLLLGRPDSLGLLLALSALLVHGRWPRSSLALAGCTILLLLAFFTKVTTLVVAISIVVSLAILHRDPRRALAFALGLGTGLASALAVANTLTNGLYGVFSFKLMHQWTRYSVPFMTQHAAWLCFRYLPVWLILVLSGRSWLTRPGLRGVLATHVVVALPATTVLLLNTGGYAFYWYVALPAAAVVCCAALATEVRGPGSRRALAAQAIMAVWLARAAGWSGPVPSPALAEDWKPLAALVEATDGPVMNDDATAILNLWRHKELYSEGVGYLNNVAWLEKNCGLRVQGLEMRLRTHYYRLLLNPEDRAMASRYYTKVGSFEIPVQLGHRRTIDVFAPHDRGPTSRGERVVR